MKKLVLLCIVTMLILSLVALVVGCQQQPKPAAPAPTPAPTPAPAPVAITPPSLASQTYTNSEFGFSVECPKDWAVAEGPIEKKVLFARPTIVVWFSGPATDAGEISLRIGREQLREMPRWRLGDYVRVIETKTKREAQNFKTMDERSIIIDEIPAEVRSYTYTWEGSKLKETKAYLIKEDTNVAWIITYLAAPAAYDQHAVAFDLAISTFKFD